MAPRFFQGASLTGQVKASSAQTFREVVDILRLCPALGVTRREFFALDEKKRNEAKQVPFFVAACFRASPSKRVYDQATHCNLIFLDIDPEKENRNGKWVETGNYPAAPFVNDRSKLEIALAGYNFAAHLTASSTPDAPRMRVIVEAKEIPLALYPRAVMAIAAALGLPSVTRESKVAVQPMFLPVMFRDSTEEEHPLITYSLDGVPFTVQDIGDELFAEFEKPKANGPNGATAHGSLDILDFLRAPIPEITLAVAREALFSLDADCSRQDWFNLAAALRHQFSPHKEQDAFELFDEWSETGDKYEGEEDTRKLWKSVKQTPANRSPITIRSLLRAAGHSGWDDRKVKETCFNALTRWMEEEAETVTELMDHGVKKILAAPLLSAVQEDVLITQLAQQAKKRFAYTISVSAFRRDLARVKLELRNLENPAEKTREPLWTKSVCYIAAAQEFYRHRTGEKYKPESFNSIYARKLLPTEESLKEMGIPATPAALSKPIVAPADYALNHIKIPTVYDYAYDPAQPTEVVFVNRGRKFVNTYTPTYPELDTARAEEAQEIIEGHFSNLIGETSYRRTLLDFMAFMVQFPGRKIRWAVLVQSVEGGGKTFLAEVMKTALGAEHVKTISGEAIKKGWNEWSFGSQLVVLEEVRVAGTNRHEIMNALKPLITNNDISVNERNRNTRQVDNISNYMMFSNYHNALALNPGDRRYFVVKSPLQSKEQVRALGEDYFPRLYTMLREMPGAVRAFLHEWEISPDFRPDGHAPRTTYVDDLIADSATDLSAAVRRLMLEGDYPLLQYDIVSAKTLLSALQLEEGMNRVTAQQLSHVLREEGMRHAGRHLLNGERHYLWTRADIPERRACDLATDRLERNAKNLGMEMLYF